MSGSKTLPYSSLSLKLCLLLLVLLLFCFLDSVSGSLNSDESPVLVIAVSNRTV